MINQFDSTWPHGHVTRDGEWDAEILRSDIAGDAPIVAVLTCRKTKKQIVHMYEADGKKDGRYSLSSIDLLNAPAPKKKVWVNWYQDKDGHQFTTGPFDAESRARNNIRDMTSAEYSFHKVIACIEVEEGQGLSREDDRS